MTQLFEINPLTTAFSYDAYTINLVANTPLTLTVPGNNSQKYEVQFSWPYNANVWVGFNLAASIPIDGVITSTPNNELRPDKRFVRGGDVLSFVSSAIVSDSGVRFLTIPG